MSGAPGPAILVAGIGNVLFGDDGFGVEVARRLSARVWSSEVRVVELGTRSMDLAYALMDGPRWAIVIDAMPRGGAPGTVYVIEPRLDTSLEPGAGATRGHGMDAVSALRLARATTGSLPALRVVGCEPSASQSEEMHLGLSPPVAEAVEAACATVEALVRDAQQILSHDSEPQGAWRDA